MVSTRRVRFLSFLLGFLGFLLVLTGGCTDSGHTDSVPSVVQGETFEPLFSMANLQPVRALEYGEAVYLATSNGLVVKKAADPNSDGETLLEGKSLADIALARAYGRLFAAVKGEGVWVLNLDDSLHPTLLSETPLAVSIPEGSRLAVWDSTLYVASDKLKGYAFDGAETQSVSFDVPVMELFAVDAKLVLVFETRVETRGAEKPGVVGDERTFLRPIVAAAVGVSHLALAIPKEGVHVLELNDLDASELLAELPDVIGLGASGSTLAYVRASGLVQTVGWTDAGTPLALGGFIASSEVGFAAPAAGILWTGGEKGLEAYNVPPFPVWRSSQGDFPVYGELALHFSEALDPSSLPESLTLLDGSEPVEHLVLAGLTPDALRVIPSAALEANRSYQLEITGEITDAFGAKVVGAQNVELKTGAYEDAWSMAPTGCSHTIDGRVTAGEDCEEWSGRDGIEGAYGMWFIDYEDDAIFLRYRTKETFPALEPSCPARFFVSLRDGYDTLYASLSPKGGVEATSPLMDTETEVFEAAAVYTSAGNDWEWKLPFEEGTIALTVELPGPSGDCDRVVREPLPLRFSMESSDDEAFTASVSRTPLLFGIDPKLSDSADSIRVVAVGLETAENSCTVAGDFADQAEIIGEMQDFGFSLTATDEAKTGDLHLDCGAVSSNDLTWRLSTVECESPRCPTPGEGACSLTDDTLACRCNDSGLWESLNCFEECRKDSYYNALGCQVDSDNQPVCQCGPVGIACEDEEADDCNQLEYTCEAGADAAKPCCQDPDCECLEGLCLHEPCETDGVCDPLCHKRDADCPDCSADGFCQVLCFDIDGLIDVDCPNCDANQYCNVECLEGGYEDIDCPDCSEDGACTPACHEVGFRDPDCPACEWDGTCDYDCIGFGIVDHDCPVCVEDEACPLYCLEVGLDDPDCPNCSENAVCNAVCNGLGYHDPDCPNCLANDDCNLNCYEALLIDPDCPDCTGNDVCNATCAVLHVQDPDCPNCFSDGVCNRFCVDYGITDPDCPNCSENGTCEHRCHEQLIDDPDCPDCFGDAFCNTACFVEGLDDPDCPDCSQDDYCRHECVDLGIADPDCPLCPEDGSCNWDCVVEGLDDPDCPDCSDDGECESACRAGTDPDCPVCTGTCNETVEDRAFCSVGEADLYCYCDGTQWWYRSCTDWCVARGFEGSDGCESSYRRQGPEPWHTECACTGENNWTEALGLREVVIDESIYAAPERRDGVEFIDWSAARDRCIAWGGDLVIFTDLLEAQSVREAFLEGDERAWIGLSDVEAEGYLQWVGGGTTLYSEALDLENEPRLDCASIDADGEVLLHLCDRNYFTHICEKPLGEVPGAYLGDKWLSDVRRSRDDAATRCTELGMHLASVSTRAEYDWLAANLPREEILLGLGRETDGENWTLLWDDDSPVDYLPQTTISGSGACGIRYPSSGNSWTWQWRDCGLRHRFLCEPEFTAAVTSAPVLNPYRVKAGEQIDVSVSLIPDAPGTGVCAVLEVCPLESTQCMVVPMTHEAGDVTQVFRVTFSLESEGDYRHAVRFALGASATDCEDYGEFLRWPGPEADDYAHGPEVREFVLPEWGAERVVKSDTLIRAVPVSEGLDWASAAERCGQSGGELAVFQSENEWLDFLAAFFGLVNGNYWIGLSDAEEEGALATADGETPPFVLERIQESNDDDKDCAAASLGDDLGWSMAACAETSGYLCRETISLEACETERTFTRFPRQHVSALVAGDGDFLPACADFRPRGTEKIFGITMEKFQTLRIRAQGDASPVAVYVLADCAARERFTCYVGSDSAAESAEGIIFTAPYEGTFYLVVDGIETTATPFTLWIDPAMPFGAGDDTTWEMGDFAYTLVPDVSSRGWSEASCRLWHGGRLAGLTNRAEETQALGVIDDGDEWARYWIGLEKAYPSGEIRWNRPDTAFSYVPGGVVGGGESPCAVLVRQGKESSWRWEDCAAKWPALCERDLDLPECSPSVVLASDEDVETGSTEFYVSANNYSAYTPTCIPDAGAAGMEKTLGMELSAGEVVDIELDAELDVSAYVVHACPSVDLAGGERNKAVYCFDGVDAVAGAGVENLAFVAPADDTYFLVIDAAQTGTHGSVHYTIQRRAYTDPLAGGTPAYVAGEEGYVVLGAQAMDWFEARTACESCPVALGLESGSGAGRVASLREAFGASGVSTAWTDLNDRAVEGEFHRNDHAEVFEGVPAAEDVEGNEEGRSFVALRLDGTAGWEARSWDDGEVFPLCRRDFDMDCTDISDTVTLSLLSEGEVWTNSREGFYGSLLTPKINADCGGSPALGTGAEQLIRIQPTGGETVEVKLYSTVFDAVLAIVPGCDSAMQTCIAKTDGVLGPGMESVRFTVEDARPVFVVMDTKTRDAAGTWQAMARLVSTNIATGETFSAGDAEYLLGSESVSWLTAYDTCHNWGGDLAAPSTVSERDALLTQLQTRVSAYRQVWSGLTDKPFFTTPDLGEDDPWNGRLTWTNGESYDPAVHLTYEHVDDKDCMVYYYLSSGVWKDVPKACEQDDDHKALPLCER